MRICVVASSRFPLAEPFAGGLEAHSHQLVLELRRRGHDVLVFAAPGSDPALRAEHLPVSAFASSAAARADVAAPPERWMEEHHAYLDLMLRLRDAEVDVIHNNSLHHLPIALSTLVAAPVVTTLHTPPLPWLESAVRLASPGCRFVAVSAATAAAWRHCVRADVVPNGVDCSRWTPGPGGDRAVWFGRLVPEKAPHLAIAAARRAGMGLDLVGPVGDAAYVAEHVAPHLDDQVVHRGHLDHRGLDALLGRAAVAVVTPAWDEPFGLVAVEAMATGTPVAAFARGALGEIVDARSGRLAPADDVDALATAMRQAARLDRADVRRRVESTFSLRAMVDGYERVYADVAASPRAA
ncbi:glycosyltransferase [Nocardioides zeae]|uniref:Glycosyltransferase n=1 Tax=Nocardioides imazamoxiresistens TaxID=3231893 RepID=A0ABU3PQG4_9ACTN|nr:glycosyltransferase [Nocardioides zeae]MDT9591458.1 glycosyltransferase [Nocardioides zeae]